MGAVNCEISKKDQVLQVWTVKLQDLDNQNDNHRLFLIKNFEYYYDFNNFWIGNFGVFGFNLNILPISLSNLETTGWLKSLLKYVNPMQTKKKKNSHFGLATKF